MTRLLQINLNRSREAQSLLFHTRETCNIDILLVSEPNKSVIKDNADWIVDNQLDAAIKVYNKMIKNFGAGHGFAWVEFEKLVVFSCYISPNTRRVEYEIFLDELSEHINANKKDNQIVVAGDFNAKSHVWGAQYEDLRGSLLNDWMATHHLSVANEGNKPTFNRREQHSIIDITFVSTSLVPKITNWHVSDIESLSDHNLIIFTVEDLVPIIDGDSVPRTSKWKYSADKAIKMEAKLQEELSKLEGSQVSTFVSTLQKVCSEVLETRGRKGRAPVYWWNSTIKNLRNTCITKRRAWTRARGRGNISTDILEDIYEEYRRSRWELKQGIKSAKKQCWEDLINSVEDDVWGGGYKIVTKRTGLQPMPKLTTKEKIEIASKLFPERPIVTWQFDNDTANMPIVTKEEVVLASRRLKNGKAPGPDGIPPEVVKIVAKINPTFMASIYNNVMTKGAIPKEWKSATLILIPKPGKSQSFRPICLIDTLAKLLERIIYTRLLAEIEEKGGFSDDQYGFREGRSTVDAIQEVVRVARSAIVGKGRDRELCLGIALDIRNAFNTASWGHIIEDLTRRDVSPYLIILLKNYFTDRKITIDGRPIGVTCGVPQGSVLGPLLWNVLYDGVLRLDVPRDVRTIAFADDLMVMVIDRNEEGIVGKARDVVAKINDWLLERQLELAPEKTEIVALVGRKKTSNLVVDILGTPTQPKNAIRYLGVIIDKSLSWGQHINKNTSKASRSAMALQRLMPRLNGPGTSKRRALNSVVNSIILYAAPVCVDVLRINKYKQLLIRTQRSALIRVGCAYRTISAVAIQVLVAVPPIDLLALERSHNFGADPASRVLNRAWMLQRWQRRWENADQGRWTYRLIPDLQVWCQRKHGELDYYLTQAMSGHGKFGTYLKKMNLRGNDLCGSCGSVDSPEHTIFYCSQWSDRRSRAESLLGSTLSADNMVTLMLESPNNWKAIADLCKDILHNKDNN